MTVMIICIIGAILCLATAFKHRCRKYLVKGDLWANGYQHIFVRREGTCPKCGKKIHVGMDKKELHRRVYPTEKIRKEGMVKL